MAHNGGVEATLVKARFGSDVRKMKVHHSGDLSYNDLILKMQRIFDLSASANITLKYLDQDGDYITLADDNDVLLALETEPTLSLLVVSDDSDMLQIKKLEADLQSVRDSTIGLLETLKAVSVNCSNVIKESKNASFDHIDATSKSDEPVATIQPSVHEQVDNTNINASYGAPLLVDELMKKEQHSISDGLSSTGAPTSQTDVTTTQSAGHSTSSREGSHSEPNTEIELSANIHHSVPPVPTQSQIDRAQSAPVAPASLPPPPQSFGSQLPLATQLPPPPTAISQANQQLPANTMMPLTQAPLQTGSNIRFGIAAPEQVPPNQFGMQPTQTTQGYAPSTQFGMQGVNSTLQQPQARAPSAGTPGMAPPPTSFPGSMPPSAFAPPPSSFTSQPQMGAQVAQSAPYQMTNTSAPAAVATYNPSMMHPNQPTGPPSSIGAPPTSLGQTNAFGRNSPAAAGHPPTMPPPTMPFGAVPGGMNPFARGAQPSHHMRFPLQPSYQPQ